MTVLLQLTLFSGLSDRAENTTVHLCASSLLIYLQSRPESQNSQNLCPMLSDMH